MFEICPICFKEYDNEKRVKANFVGRTKCCYKCYNEQQKIIALDFDATIADYDGWKGEGHKGKLLEGAREFMEELVDMGFELYIVTSRPLRGIQKWIEANNITHLIKGTTNLKIAAYCYLDDRAIQFNNNFTEALENIKNFVPWYKNK
jgi:phosphoglycolate phosphatase-like HAD superfamily hydrolase